MRKLLEDGDIDRLRQALATGGYEWDVITHRYGEAAVTAASRGDHRGLLAATEDEDPQSTLVRLFLCGVAASAEATAAALAPLPTRVARAAGLLVAEPDGFRAGLGLQIHAGQWILADLPAELGGTVRPDHVLGVGAAARSLSEYMIDRPVKSALDIGTGCGIQALRLSRHADQVTATDVLPRALQLAATNAALNGVHWELLAGDMLEPVADRRFDQVVCNPPFIVGPGATDFRYRDSGRPGDAVCAELAGAAPRLLNPGGTMQFLANWLHVRGEDWRDRVTGWIADDCDAWVIERDVCDPLDYVRLWQRDAGESHDPARLARWLDWFDAQDVEAVGFGLVNLRRRQSGSATVLCESVRQQPAAPWGRLITDWFDRVDRLGRMPADDLLASRPRLADGVRLEQEAVLTDEGWQVDRQVLSDTAGLLRREEIEPLIVSFLAGCTGAVDLRTIVDLLARAHDAPADLLAASLSSVLTGLVRRGFVAL